MSKLLRLKFGHKLNPITKQVGTAFWYLFLALNVYVFFFGSPIVVMSDGSIL